MEWQMTLAKGHKHYVFIITHLSDDNITLEKLKISIWRYKYKVCTNKFLKTFMIFSLIFLPEKRADDQAFTYIVYMYNMLNLIFQLNKTLFYALVCALRVKFFCLRS